MYSAAKVEALLSADQVGTATNGLRVAADQFRKHQRTLAEERDALIARVQDPHQDCAGTFNWTGYAGTPCAACGRPLDLGQRPEARAQAAGLRATYDRLIEQFARQEADSVALAERLEDADAVIVSTIDEGEDQ